MDFHEGSGHLLSIWHLHLLPRAGSSTRRQTAHLETDLYSLDPQEVDIVPGVGRSEVARRYTNPTCRRPWAAIYLWPGSKLYLTGAGTGGPCTPGAGRGSKRPTLSSHRPYWESTQRERDQGAVRYKNRPFPQLSLIKLIGVKINVEEKMEDDILI